MIKPTSKDKDLLLTILASGCSVAAMLAVMQVIGQLNGATSMIVVLIVQSAFLTRRVAVLERELRSARGFSDGAQPKFVEKTV